MHTVPDQRRKRGHLQKEQWAWIKDQHEAPVQRKTLCPAFLFLWMAGDNLGHRQEIAEEKIFEEEFLGLCRVKNRDGKQVQGVCRQLHVQQEGLLLLGPTCPCVPLSGKKSENGERKKDFSPRA